MQWRQRDRWVSSLPLRTPRQPGPPPLLEHSIARMTGATTTGAARKTHFIREFKTGPILTFTASFLSLYQPGMSVTGTCPERQHATGNCAITIGNRPNPLQGEHTLKPLKWLAVVALSGALAACASDIQRVRSAEGTGSPFPPALTTENKDFLTFRG